MRWMSLWQRPRLEDELDDELRFHFESVVERCVREGMTTEAARRRARVEHRGEAQIKEECRDMRGVSFIENLARDAAYAWRGLVKNPGFALTAMGTIALGVGMNTALFSLVYTLVFRPLPVKDPDSIRNVYMATRGEGNRGTHGTQYFISYAEFNFWRAHTKTADLAAFSDAEMSWKGIGGRPLHAQLCSENLLTLLGARPLLGRFFSAEEASRPGSAAVVVLTYSSWRNHLGGAKDIVGQTITLNRTPFTIIGVADERTNGPSFLKPDLWIPYTMQALTRPGEALIQDPTVGWIQAVGRKKPGVSDAEIRSEMEVIGQQSLLPHNPKRKAMVTVAPGAFLNYPMIMRDGKPVAAILFLAVSLVLLVACANVANMLLARGMARRKEMAIRLSIGAGRGRILQQLLVESAMLGVAGGLMGLLLAQWAGHGVLAMVPMQEIGAHQIDLSPNITVLLYTIGVSLITGLVFGLIPALNALRVDLTPALKSEGLDAAGRTRRMWLQHGLIGIQVAVCLVLLVNAGLLLRGFERGLHMDAGHAAEKVLIGHFDLRQQQYKPEQAADFLNALRDNISSAPGVRAASLMGFDPVISSCGMRGRLLQSDGNAGESFDYACFPVSAGHFATLRIPLFQGRTFTAAEMKSGARVAIIDEELARRYFGGKSPIGQRLRLGDKPEDDHEIVGMAGNTRSYSFSVKARPAIYTPLTGMRLLRTKLLVSYEGPRAPVVKSIENAAAALDGNVSARATPIEENVSMALTPVKMGAAAASALGGLALLLACTGVYGVVSFAVSRRKREVGIRMALGAEKSDVLRLILWQGMKPVAAGAAIGILLAAVGAQLIRAMLYGVSTLDPVSFGSMAGLLGAVAASAALVPAAAAMRVEPAAALRQE